MVRQKRAQEKEERLEQMKLKAQKEEEERQAQAEAHKQEILAGIVTYCILLPLSLSLLSNGRRL